MDKLFDDEDRTKISLFMAGRQTGKTMMAHNMMELYLKEYLRINELKEVEDKLEQLGL